MDSVGRRSRRPYAACGRNDHRGCGPAGKARCSASVRSSGSVRRHRALGSMSGRPRRDALPACAQEAEVVEVEAVLATRYRRVNVERRSTQTAGLRLHQSPLFRPPARPRRACDVARQRRPAAHEPRHRFSQRRRREFLRSRD